MKPVFLAIGLLVLAAAWFGPLPKLAQGAFYAHMLMHMGVVAVAAPFLALGISGTRWDPAGKMPKLFAPIPASAVELVVVWAWHAPALHQAARHSSWGFVLEQGTFLLAGLWVWVASLGAGGADRNRSAAGIVALLLTSMHMTLLGALLALSPRALYMHHAHSHGLSPLEDQHLGGAIMILTGGISYMAGGLGLTVSLLRHKLLNSGVKPA